MPGEFYATTPENGRVLASYYSSRSPMKSFYSWAPPPPPPQPPLVKPGQVNAFYSLTRWKAYFEASKSSNKLIVIDFTAQWCGPCRTIEPMLNALAAKYTDVDFVKIDVDLFMDVASKFDINVMPTFVFLKRGKEVDKVVGTKTEELMKRLQNHTARYY